MYFNSKQFCEINIELTNNCNFNCWFCPRHAMQRPLGFMKREVFESLILSLADQDIFQEIALAGIGEPTLHKHLLPMIRFVKQHTPFKVVLTSNGSRFTDKDYVEALWQTGVDKVTVSFRVTDPVADAASLPAGFAYDAYLEGIISLAKSMQKRGGEQELEIACFKDTFYSRYILGIRPERFINDHRLTCFLDELLAVFSVGSMVKRSFLDQLKGKLTNVDRLLIVDGLSFRFDGLSSWTNTLEKYKNTDRCYHADFGSCLGLQSHCALYWNGDVSTCCADFDCQNRLGNIREETVFDILSSSKAVSFAASLKARRMPTATCKICRGGMTRKEQLANMFGSLLFHVSDTH